MTRSVLGIDVGGSSVKAGLVDVDHGCLLGDLISAPTPQPAAPAGVMAVIYNRALLQTMSALDRLDHWPVEIRAALIGAGVGAVAWVLPDLVGGGDAITQRTLLGAVEAAGAGAHRFRQSLPLL